MGNPKSSHRAVFYRYSPWHCKTMKLRRGRTQTRRPLRPVTAIGFSVSSETSLGTQEASQQLGCLQGGAELMFLQPPRLWTPRSVASHARWGLRPEHLILKAPLPTSEPLKWTLVESAEEPSAHRIWRTLSAPAPRLRITWPLSCFVHHVPSQSTDSSPSLKRKHLYTWPLTSLKGHKSSFAEDKNKKLPERQILSTLQFCLRNAGQGVSITTLDSFNGNKKADVTCWLIVPVQKKKRKRWLKKKIKFKDGWYEKQ